MAVAASIYYWRVSGTAGAWRDRRTDPPTPGVPCAWLDRRLSETEFEYAERAQGVGVGRGRPRGTSFTAVP